MATGIDITKLVKAEVHPIIREQDFLEYWAYSAHPAKGLLYITHNNHEFISGHVRMRARPNGSYPYFYTEMIENLFGKEENTIEVCSRSVHDTFYTVDIDPKCNPSFVTDGQTLAGVYSNMFKRWRCDPPYNEKTAREMYHCSLPNTAKLLQAGARVCKEGALLFLLLGAQNYQYCPPSIKRIGWVAITIVPNNELRALHIYLKIKNDSYDDQRYRQSQL